MKGNKPTPEQEFHLGLINIAGGSAFVAYSSAEAIDALRNLATEPK